MKKLSLLILFIFLLSIIPSSAQNPEELYQQGIEYANSRDYKKAGNCFRKAAKGGNIDAQYKIGRLLRNYDNQLYNISEKEAIKWLREAAQQGHILSQKLLGSTFFCNKISSEERLNWLKKAAEQGDEKSQMEVAHHYRYKYKGSNDDLMEAIRWCKLAADNGNDEAMLEIGNCYRNLNKYENAEYWYKKAGEKGNSKAYEELGRLYDTKFKDYDKAIEWYKKAVELGNKNIFFELGLIYQYIKKDYEEAIKCYKEDHYCPVKVD